MMMHNGSGVNLCLGTRSPPAFCLLTLRTRHIDRSPSGAWVCRPQQECRRAIIASLSPSLFPAPPCTPQALPRTYSRVPFLSPIPLVPFPLRTCLDDDIGQAGRMIRAAMQCAGAVQGARNGTLHRRQEQCVAASRGLFHESRFHGKASSSVFHFATGLNRRIRSCTGTGAEHRIHNHYSAARISA